MPRKGFTSITIPQALYDMLVNLCDRYDLPMGKCILFLYELYRSIVHDPGMKGYYEKKIERILRRIDKKYKQLITESKQALEEEMEEEE